MRGQCRSLQVPKHHPFQYLASRLLLRYICWGSTRCMVQRLVESGEQGMLQLSCPVSQRVHHARGSPSRHSHWRRRRKPTV
jgi:hypothetical protein